MTREDFIRKCAAMGVGIGLLPSLLTSCEPEDVLEVNFSGKVLIIGAGAAGLMAAYTCNQNNIDFEVIEATSVYGGRVKMTDTFADFPIDLGAEWLHTSPSVFSEMVNDASVEGQIEMIPYMLDTMYTWSDGSLNRQNWASTFYGEYKFLSTTWYQFFEQYIAPGILNKVVFDSPVNSIDYAGGEVVVTDTNGVTYRGDRLIVTVPLNILKNGSIGFDPPLPTSKTEALAKTDMPDGIKVFMKFSERFYPDILLVGNLLGGSNAEQIYYDAAFKKASNDNVMGLFTVGPDSSQFTSLSTDQEIIDAVLAQLDTIFEGKASQFYQSHVIQNWSKEPYIGGSYSFGGDNYEELIAEISAPLDNKVFFAGEALNTESWATVHGAGLSGVAVAKSVLQNS